MYKSANILQLLFPVVEISWRASTGRYGQTKYRHLPALQIWRWPMHQPLAASRVTDGEFIHFKITFRVNVLFFRNERGAYIRATHRLKTVHKRTNIDGQTHRDIYGHLHTGTDMNKTGTDFRTQSNIKHTDTDTDTDRDGALKSPEGSPFSFRFLPLPQQS